MADGISGGDGRLYTRPLCQVLEPIIAITELGLESTIAVAESGLNAIHIVMYRDTTHNSPTTMPTP